MPVQVMTWCRQETSQLYDLTHCSLENVTDKLYFSNLFLWHDAMLPEDHIADKKSAVRVVKKFEIYTCTTPVLEGLML